MLVGGVAVEGVGDGRCGVTGPVSLLCMLCAYMSTSQSTVMSTSCTVHHIHVLLNCPT